MTDKEIFKEIWLIKDVNARAERMTQLAEQDKERAVRIEALLQYSDRFQAVLEDPLVFFDSGMEERETARYSIKSELAKGGMGVIYAAYDSQMRRDVVLKCLQLKHRDNFQAVQRFYNEAHITGQLQHPGIAPVYELGELQDGRPFYCMKLVEGETLAQFLAGSDSTSADRTTALNFFLQTCQTMAFVHERGVIHRDLKPSNIMVGDHGQTQVMDWGVAKKLAADDEQSQTFVVQQTRADMADDVFSLKSDDAEHTPADLTRHGQVVGTPGYMSPEQSKGRNDLINKQSDVYSLGAILWEILSGARLGEAEDESTVRNEASLNHSCRPRCLDSNVDSELADLARSCLQSDPADRPSDADAVAQKMLAYFASRETAAQTVQIKLEKELTRNEEARKRRLSFVICVVACLGILIAGIVGTSIGFYRENEARTLADQKAEDARVAKDLAISAKIAADDSKAQAEARLTQLAEVNKILGSVFENLHLNRSARSSKPLMNLLVKNLDQAAEQLDEDSIGAPDVIASFQAKIGKYYHAFGAVEKAIPLLEKADRFVMAEYGLESEIARNTRSQLADSLSANKQVKRANSLYQDLQEFYVRSGETDTRDFLRIQCKLASNYLIEDKRRKALELIETSSELGLEIIGVEYGIQMARIYNYNRMPIKAIEVLNAVLSKTDHGSDNNSDEMGRNDPQVETAKVLLARSYLRLDQYRKALPILEKLSLSFRGQDRYGNDPGARSYIVSYSLARALQGVGRYRDSIKHLKTFIIQTQGKSKRLYQQRVFALSWLFEAYVKTEDFSRAIETANRLYRYQVAKYGTGHWRNSLSTAKLANVHLLVNQPEKAKEYLDVDFVEHEFPEDRHEQYLNQKRFMLAMVAANQGDLEVASRGFREADEFFGDAKNRQSNTSSFVFDNLEPKIWLAESLALQGDKEAIQVVEEFESEIKERFSRLDELIVPTQYLYRACVARYVVKPDETLVLRLNELIEILSMEHFKGTQTHLLWEARSLLGMTYLKLGRTFRAQRMLKSSFASLQSIKNPRPQTNQAIIDAGERLAHFHSLTNANEDAERVRESIREVEPNLENIPAFSRELVDRTLTTDSK